MAGLSSPGIGSGLDINGIITQLMTLERRPLVALQTRQIELKTQVSAYGNLQSALAGFQSAMEALNEPSKFKVFSAVSSETKVLTATAASDAAKGQFSLEVTRIAENHRMATAGAYSETDTFGLPGDTVTIQVGADAFTVDIGEKTLAGIRDAINAASDNKGVTASLIKDDTGSRLVLSANATGSTSALQLSYSGVDPLALTTLNADRDGSGGFTAADLDAALMLEGLYSVTSASNTVSDVIQGVTLTLKESGTTTLKVDRDTGAVQTAIQSFAKAYNGVVQTIAKLRSQALRGDSAGLINIESQMRAALNTATSVSGKFSLPFQLGISTQRDGTLSVDTTVLGKALETDFDGVAAMFSDAENGLAVRLKRFADGYLGAGGILDGRTESLNAEDRRIEIRKAQIEARLIAREQALVRQYAALDAMVAQMQAMNTSLTTALDQLPGFTPPKR